MEYPQILVHKRSLNDNVAFVIDTIKQNNIEFDFILARGISGIVPGVLVAEKLGKELCILRKPNENSHSRREVEISPDLYAPDKKYIIIDDLVCTGETVRKIIYGAKHSLGMHNFIPEAIILYASEWVNHSARTKEIHEMFMVNTPIKFYTRISL